MLGTLFPPISPTLMPIFRQSVGHDSTKLFNYSRRSSQVDTPGAVGFSYSKNINYREQVSHMIYRISRLWNMTVKKTLSLCAAEIKTCFLKLINMNFRTVATMFSRTRHVSNAHAMRRKEVIAMRVRQTTFIAFSWVVKYIYHELSLHSCLNRSKIWVVITT